MREIRCSGLARVMACAGYPFFTDLPEQEDSAPAAEGTAAGECLRALLEGAPIPYQASNGVAIDEDMKFYTKPLGEQIRSVATSPVLCEQRIDWQTRSGIWIRGSYDASYMIGDILCVDDLKYGYGIVEVKENWQLLGYAIGEMLRQGRQFRGFRLRIMQPRPHHEDGSVREWNLSFEELCFYKEKIEAQMTRIASGDHTLTTSKHCKYCEAAGAACPAFNKMFFHGIEKAQSFIQDSITDAELSFQLELADRISEVIKIKRDSLKALAVDRIKRGKIVPGWITEPSYGDRKWKASVSPEVVKTLTGKDIVKREMLSPAQAEKIGVPKEFVNALVERHFKGQNLVRKSPENVGDKIFGSAPPPART